MEKLKAQLQSQLQDQKYKYEIQIEELKQASQLERNAMDNLPTKELGMKVIEETIE